MTDGTGRFDGYWGLKVIAKRMGCSVDQLRRLYDKHGFFMFLIPNPRRKHPHNLSSKLVWYTCEPLIHKWMLLQVYAQREERKKHGGRWWAKEHGVI